MVSGGWRDRRRVRRAWRLGGRTIREITGEDPDEAELPAQVSYSHKAVEDLVKKVEGEVNQPAIPGRAAP